MEVGIRELRADLSRWLKRVEAGEAITVTDHGRPVARVIPADEIESAYDKLVREGVITPAKRPRRKTLPPPVKAKGSVSDLVLEGRR